MQRAEQEPAEKGRHGQDASIDAQGGVAAVPQQDGLHEQADRDRERGPPDEQHAGQAIQEQMGARRPEPNMDGGGDEERRRHESNAWNFFLTKPASRAPDKNAGKDISSDPPWRGQDSIADMNGEQYHWGPPGELVTRISKSYYHAAITLQDKASVPTSPKR
jgi:hypothetical protein